MKHGRKQDKPMDKAYIDDLTGVYNRRFLANHAPKMLGNTLGNKTSLSVVIIDIDYFKNINDTFGHSHGDIILKEFSTFLKNLLRNDDLVFRFGGDEFVCLLPDTAYQQARIVGERFVEKCRVKEFSRVRLTISIGIASAPDHGRQWQELFDIADQNLYNAKRHGRDQVGLFQTEKKLLIPTRTVIGRTQEIEKLYAVMKSLLFGNSSVMCIVGEAGVGKTTLIDKVLKDNYYSEICAMRSNLSITTKSIPYYPFREMLRTIIGKNDTRLREIPEAYRIELIKLLPELSATLKMYDKGIQVVDKYRLFEGVHQLLTLEIQSRPCMLVFDNAHWADASSLDLIHYLVRSMKQNAALFILVLRSEEFKDSTLEGMFEIIAREGRFEKLIINPLGKNNVTQMIALIMGEKPPPQLIEYVFKETGGNPFFIEELVKALHISGSLYRDDERWVFERKPEMQIPYSIESVIDRKMRMISAEAREVMDCTAVIGRTFTFSTLRSLTNKNEGHLLDLLDELIKVGLLDSFGTDSYGNTEDVIWEVVYRQLSTAKAIQYHKLIAEQLLRSSDDANGGTVEDLAYHYYKAGEWQQAYEYCLRAGDRARDAYANHNATQYYTWALECAEASKSKERERTARRITCRLQRARVFNLIGNHEAAECDYKEAIKYAHVAGDLAMKATCIQALTKVCQDTGRFVQQTRLAEKALKIFQRLDNKEGMVKCMVNEANAYIFLGHAEKAKTIYRNALKIARSIDYLEAVSSILLNLGVTMKETGELPRALKLYREALRISRKIGNRVRQASCITNIGVVYDMYADYSKALSYFRRALKEYEEVGNRTYMAIVLNNIGAVYKNMCNYERALQIYKQSLNINQQVGNRHAGAIIKHGIASLKHLQGDVAGARSLVEQAYNALQESGDLSNTIKALSTLGTIHYDLGNITRALQTYKRTLKLNETLGNLDNKTELLVLIGNIMSDRGDYNAAEQCYRKAQAAIRNVRPEIAAYVYLGLSVFYLQTGSIKRAMIAAGKLRAYAKKLPSKLLKGHEQCICGQLHARIRRWKKADAAFNAAQSIFKHLNYRFGLGQVCYHRGRMFQECGDQAAAAQWFSEAKKTFRKLRAKHWLKKTETCLQKKIKSFNQYFTDKRNRFTPAIKCN